MNDIDRYGFRVAYDNFARGFYIIYSGDTPHNYLLKDYSLADVVPEDGNYSLWYYGSEEEAKQHLEKYFAILDQANEIKEMARSTENTAGDSVTCKQNTGGSSSWYELPKDATQLQDLIEHRNMNGNIKDIFKACYRLGEKEGVSDEYNVRKMVYYSLREFGRMVDSKDYLGLAEEIIGDQSEK